MLNRYMIINEEPQSYKESRCSPNLWILIISLAYVSLYGMGLGLRAPIAIVRFKCNLMM